jgi:ribosomal protein L11 methyltransferase
MAPSEPHPDVTVVGGLPLDVVVELDVAGGSDAVELASDRLWAGGATAVGETVGGLAGSGRAGGAGERGGVVVTLVASFPTPAAARVVAAEVGGRAVEVTDVSWRDRWKDFAGPVEIGQGLVVAPAWREVEVRGAEVGAGGSRLVVRIDPGPCFGSGTHPSTRLVLAELLAAPPVGAAVFDVGCGSGILSVTAAMLGATSVTAVDVDPDAVTATTANAAANGVSDRVVASTTTAAEVVAGGATRFDLVLVNVTAGVHAVIGPDAAGAARPGATLVLAGLLPGQWRHVAGAYPGTSMVRRPDLDGWEGVVLVRDAG